MEQPVKALYTPREDGDYDFLMAVSYENISAHSRSTETEEELNEFLSTLRRDLLQDGISAVIIGLDDIDQVSDVMDGAVVDQKI